MKTKVAVVVPVFNAENFLERGIECLIDQSLKELKIVCVNDASQDNCGTILNKYAEKDNRIIVLNHDINKGAGCARNTGLDYIFNNFPELVLQHGTTYISITKNHPGPKFLLAVMQMLSPTPNKKRLLW